MDWWRPIAGKIADFNSRVVLALVYLIVFAPVALFVRLLSDPLRLKKASDESLWEKPQSDNESVEAWRRQF